MTYEWEGRLRSGSAGDTTVDLPVILLEIDPDASDPNTSVVKTYLYAHAQILAQHDGHYAEPIYFYLHDRLGSVRQMIDADGTVKNTYTYDPWGQPFTTEVEATLDNPWTFTGQWYDAEIAQYFLRARMYDPAIYRFTARDPDLGQWTEPLTLHRYLYCLNDPIDRIDPSGLSSLAEEEVTVGTGSTVNAAGGSNAKTMLDMARGFKNFWNFRNKMLDYAIQTKDGVWQWTGKFGHEIHHIVGKGWGNAARFGNNMIHSFQNLVSLPKELHGPITQFFNSGPRVHTFMAKMGIKGSLQKWLATKSFEVQAQWGMAVLDHLIAYGTLTNFNPCDYGLMIR